MKRGTVLITGAYGFMGRNLARLYGEQGWHVIGLGHGVWSRTEWTEWNIAEWHTCDITIGSLLTYAGRPDVIVHCAGGGSVGFSVSHPLQDYERTATTTAEVLEFVRIPYNLLYSFLNEMTVTLAVFLFYELVNLSLNSRKI